MQPVDNLPLNDHEAIQFSLDVVSLKQINCSRLLYNYKKADLQHFCEVLSRVPWNCISSDNIDEAWSLWKDLFFCAADSAIPKVRWKKSKVEHWFFHDTIHLIKVKRRLCKSMVKSPTSEVAKSKKVKVKQVSNLVRSKTRQDIETHVSNLSKQYSESPKPFSWRWLNSSHSPIPPLLHQNGNISDDSHKAEVINAYFSSVFTADDGSDIANLRDSLSIHTSIIESIHFTVKDAYKVLISLQCDKACGSDLFPSRQLNLGAEYIVPSLAQLLSLSSGKLPSD